MLASAASIHTALPRGPTSGICCTPGPGPPGARGCVSRRPTIPQFTHERAQPQPRYAAKIRED